MFLDPLTSCWSNYAAQNSQWIARGYPRGSFVRRICDQAIHGRNQSQATRAEWNVGDNVKRQFVCAAVVIYGVVKYRHAIESLVTDALIWNAFTIT